METLHKVMDIRKGEEEVTNYTENKTGVVSFRWKGKDFEAEYTKTIGDNYRGGYFCDITLEKPKSISDDDWDLIYEDLNDEVR